LINDKQHVNPALGKEELLRTKASAEWTGPTAGDGTIPQQECPTIFTTALQHMQSFRLIYNLT
jgi:hypothetical protein